MTRTRILAAVATAAVGLTLTACGGVDREGSRESIMESMEAAGFDADEACVESVLDGYTDDELTSINDAIEANGTSPEAEDFAVKILDCVPIPT